MAEQAQANLLAAETGSDLTGSEMHAWLATRNQQDRQVTQAILTWKALQKLRQVETAVRFLERRSDFAASLPSEVRAHAVAKHCLCYCC